MILEFSLQRGEFMRQLFMSSQRFTKFDKGLNHNYADLCVSEAFVSGINI